jgi:hypothetical protein
MKITIKKLVVHNYAAPALERAANVNSTKLQGNTAGNVYKTNEGIDDLGYDIGSSKVHAKQCL